ncbi:MAG TPA: GFA family protein [Thermoleophilaceae bacterium]|jgi:hypothetical protein
MAESSPITGRCLCGRVRFEVSEPLLEAEYCHCKRCQRRTGTAASASALTAPGTFRVTEGEELLGAFKPDDGWHDYFCRECGGHLYGRSHEDPRLICVAMGAIDGDPGVRPAFHQFVAYAAPWDPLPDDGLPRFDERVPSDIQTG